MSLVTRGYGSKAKLIVTRGYGIISRIVLYSLPRCITRRLPVLKTTRAISGEVVFRRREMETSVARKAFETIKRRKAPVNTIIRRNYQELIFRDVKPCKM